MLQLLAVLCTCTMAEQVEPAPATPALRTLRRGRSAGQPTPLTGPVPKQLSAGGAGGQFSKDANAGNTKVNLLERGVSLLKPRKSVCARPLRSFVDGSVLSGAETTEGFRDMHVGNLHEWLDEQTTCLRCVHDLVNDALAAFAAKEGLGSAGNKRARRFGHHFFVCYSNMYLSGFNCDEEVLHGFASSRSMTCERGHRSVLQTSLTCKTYQAKEINVRKAMNCIDSGDGWKKVEASQAAENKPLAPNYRQRFNECIYKTGHVILEACVLSMSKAHATEQQLELAAAIEAGEDVRMTVTKPDGSKVECVMIGVSYDMHGAQVSGGTQGGAGRGSRRPQLWARDGGGGRRGGGEAPAARGPGLQGDRSATAQDVLLPFLRAKGDQGANFRRREEREEDCALQEVQSGCGCRRRVGVMRDIYIYEIMTKKSGFYHEIYCYLGARNVSISPAARFALPNGFVESSEPASNPGNRQLGNPQLSTSTITVSRTTNQEISGA